MLTDSPLSRGIPYDGEEGRDGCIGGGLGDGQRGGEASGETGPLHICLHGDGEWTTVPPLLATHFDNKVSAATWVEMSDFLIRWLLEVNPVPEGGSECSSGAFRPPRRTVKPGASPPADRSWHGRVERQVRSKEEKGAEKR